MENFYIETTIFISILIVTTILIIKLLGKKNKKKHQVTLNLSNKPNKKSSKQIIMNRLIDYEIKRKPGLSRKEAHRIALDRLARDNR